MVNPIALVGLKPQTQVFLFHDALRMDGFLKA